MSKLIVNKKLNNEDKEELIEILHNFLTENRYVLSRDIVFSRLIVKKVKSDYGKMQDAELTDNEKSYLKYVAKDIVTEKGREEKITYDLSVKILNYLMKKNPNFALWFAIKYEPKLDKYDEIKYENELNDFCNILLKNKNVYLGFVSRYGFLSKNLTKLDNIFKNLDSAEYKEALFELCLNTKIFANTEGKTKCYSILNNYILNKKKYLGYFEEFENKKINILSSSKKREIMHLDFDVDALNKLNPMKSFLFSEIINDFSGCINFINKELIESLEISDVTANFKKKDSIVISVEGEKLNQDRIEKFFTNYLTALYSNNKLFSLENKKEKVNTVLVEIDKEMLDISLPKINQEHPRKVKKI